MFSYALSPYHEGVKQNTIGVIEKTSAKLPHCMGFMLAYLMENEMSFIHHVVK